MTTFSVVATPIGNMADMTMRALEVLKKADLVLCEDTRMTKRLLDHYSIVVPTMSYHVHSKLSRQEEIIDLIKQGKNIALVSDAGTPGISDPGIELVRMLRQRLVKEILDGLIKIESIPGPSALTAAVSVAGVPCADFIFLGFLPHKKGRETLFKEISSVDRAVIFYESPHRIMKTLDSLIKFCPKKNVTVVREITKIFEEVVAGSAFEVKSYFEKNSEKVRGEFVVFVN